MIEGKKGVKEARFELLPGDALWSLARVYGYGTEKYADRNWERGYAWSKSYGAMLRHATLFWAGENIDAESGLPHAAHIAWHGLCLTAFLLREVGEDDRPREALLSMTASVTNPEEIEAAKNEAKLKDVALHRRTTPRR